ncbi:cytosolic phospholipase A2 gamma-like [Scleropages formosus]|uniref:cytosolic phospholipase A2 gamma-like n=1 Tax=Scleropages formosus TaxID=113540 RepID=UPI0010FAB811|nr:cytosolic phospholipase A2 gamma-like [Scleropages formosus]
MRKAAVCHFPSSFSKYVRVSKSLNRKEEQYIKERQAVVEKCLKDNGIKYKQKHVPVIAVLGSGGGERAMVGLLGSLAQMGEEKLLDSITYLCGVSGSTWCMASLYEDPKWSINVAADKKKIVDRLSNGKFNISDMLEWLSEAVKDENYSLTDFWAATVVYNIIKEIDRHHLSEQQDRGPTNPYPIYTAIDKGLYEDHQTLSCWFEISPYEAGYSHVGAYVITSLFGSQFEEGELKKVVKEEDMLYLQGSNTNYPRVCVLQKNEWLNLNAEERQKHVAHLSIEICKALKGLFGPLEGTSEILRKTIIALYNWTWGTKFNFLYKYPAKGKIYSNTNTTEMMLSARRSCFLQDLRLQPAFLACLAPSDSFSAHSQTQPPHYFLPGIPPPLLSDEKQYFEDAGILLNSPYVAALRPERKVDLILSFDFSSGDPFLTVKKAADYCKEAGIPFPSVVIEPGEEKNPKDFYVFKDETKAPIVIYIPLFNTVNCEEKIEEWRKRYKTFQDPYSKEMIEDLLLVSSGNVKNNKEKILNEIKAACARLSRPPTR